MGAASEQRVVVTRLLAAMWTLMASPSHPRPHPLGLASRGWRKPTRASVRRMLV